MRLSVRKLILFLIALSAGLLYAGSEARAGYVSAPSRTFSSDALRATSCELVFDSGAGASTSADRTVDQDEVRRYSSLPSPAADLSPAGAGGATSGSSPVGSGATTTPLAPSAEAEVLGPTLVRWLVRERTFNPPIPFVSGLTRPPRIESS